MSTKVKIGRLNFSASLHYPNGLAISLRMRRAEVSVDALLHVAALLGGDDQHFFAVEAGHAADDGGIVAEAPIAVDFAKVGEDTFDVVEGLRTLRMASQFRFLPGGGWCIHLAAQRIDTILQCCDLAAGCIIGARGLQFGDLAFDLLQFLLRFFCGSHALGDDADAAPPA